MRKTAFLIVILAIVFITNQCTIIGIAVGSGISKSQHEKRPTVTPKQDDNFEFLEGDWLEIVRKDGRIVEGKYVEASYVAWEGSDSMPTMELKSIELDILGRKNNETVMLNDIDHIVIGSKSNKPKLFGALIGLGIDSILWTIAAVAINNSISP